MRPVSCALREMRWMRVCEAEDGDLPLRQTSRLTDPSTRIGTANKL